MKKNETAEKLTSAFMADDLFTDDSDLVSVIDAKETAEDAEKPHGTQIGRAHV